MEMEEALMEIILRTPIPSISNEGVYHGALLWLIMMNKLKIGAK